VQPAVQEGHQQRRFQPGSEPLASDIDRVPASWQHQETPLRAPSPGTQPSGDPEALPVGLQQAGGAAPGGGGAHGSRLAVTSAANGAAEQLQSPSPEALPQRAMQRQAGGDLAAAPFPWEGPASDDDACAPLHVVLQQLMQLHMPALTAAAAASSAQGASDLDMQLPADWAGAVGKLPPPSAAAAAELRRELAGIELQLAALDAALAAAGQQKQLEQADLPASHQAPPAAAAAAAAAAASRRAQVHAPMHQEPADRGAETVQAAAPQAAAAATACEADTCRSLSYDLATLDAAMRARGYHDLSQLPEASLGQLPASVQLPEVDTAAAVTEDRVPGSRGCAAAADPHPGVGAAAAMQDQRQQAQPPPSDTAAAAAAAAAGGAQAAPQPLDRVLQPLQPGQVRQPASPQRRGQQQHPQAPQEEACGQQADGPPRRLAAQLGEPPVSKKRRTFSLQQQVSCLAAGKGHTLLGADILGWLGRTCCSASFFLTLDGAECCRGRWVLALAAAQARHGRTQQPRCEAMSRGQPRGVPLRSVPSRCWQQLRGSQSRRQLRGSQSLPCCRCRQRRMTWRTLRRQ
jgi:hypothetical protein